MDAEASWWKRNKELDIPMLTCNAFTIFKVSYQAGTAQNCFGISDVVEIGMASLKIFFFFLLILYCSLVVVWKTSFVNICKRRLYGCVRILRNTEAHVESDSRLLWNSRQHQIYILVNGELSIPCRSLFTFIISSLRNFTIKLSILTPEIMLSSPGFRKHSLGSIK